MGDNKETLQSMCKAPLPPTSPPTQATAFANIAQHWLDKYKKSKKDSIGQNGSAFTWL